MRLNVNGRIHEVDAAPDTALLYVLRNDLELNGPKYGCGIGQCAACTVLIDGRNTKSCQTPAGTAVGKAVTTVEGASGPVIDAIRDAWYRQSRRCTDENRPRLVLIDTIVTLKPHLVTYS